MKKDIVILGAGGFAREVLDVFDACNQAGQAHNVLGYIVESGYGVPGTLVNDKPILGDFSWLQGRAGKLEAICAVGAPALRLRMVRQAEEHGIGFCSVVHPGAVMTRWVAIGGGSVITAGCILTNQIRIGAHVHVNLDCTIGHDAVLGDLVTLAPGVHVSGKVVMGEGAYVGTGVNIIEGVRIGEWSVIGAGSTIVKEAPPNTTVVGVPGQVIKTRDAGWHLR